MREEKSPKISLSCRNPLSGPSRPPNVFFSVKTVGGFRKQIRKKFHCRKKHECKPPLFSLPTLANNKKLIQCGTRSYGLLFLSRPRHQACEFALITGYKVGPYPYKCHIDDRKQRLKTLNVWTRRPLRIGIFSTRSKKSREFELTIYCLIGGCTTNRAKVT